MSDPDAWLQRRAGFTARQVQAVLFQRGYSFALLEDVLRLGHVSIRVSPSRITVNSGLTWRKNNANTVSGREDLAEWLVEQVDRLLPKTPKYRQRYPVHPWRTRYKRKPEPKRLSTSSTTHPPPFVCFCGSPSCIGGTECGCGSAY